MYIMNIREDLKYTFLISIFHFTHLVLCNWLERLSVNFASPLILAVLEINITASRVIYLKSTPILVLAQNNDAVYGYWPIIPMKRITSCIKLKNSAEFLDLASPQPFVTDEIHMKVMCDGDPPLKIPIQSRLMLGHKLNTYRWYNIQDQTARNV